MSERTSRTHRPPGGEQYHMAFAVDTVTGRRELIGVRIREENPVCSRMFGIGTHIQLTDEREFLLEESLRASFVKRPRRKFEPTLFTAEWGFRCMVLYDKSHQLVEGQVVRLIQGTPFYAFKNPGKH